jgi:DNA-binding MarR family transcriptional regulator
MSLAPVLLDKIFLLSSALKHYQRDGIFCEDLSFGQYRILRFIAEHEGTTMGDLVEALGVEKSTATRLVAPLLDSGYIHKEADLVDKRIQRLHLTASGEEKETKVGRCVNGAMETILEQQSPQEWEIILKAVAQLSSAMESCC